MSKKQYQFSAYDFSFYDSSPYKTLPKFISPTFKSKRKLDKWLDDNFYGKIPGLLSCTVECGRIR